MRDWANRHPLLTNLVITLLVVVPGYLRIEGIIDDQHEIIDQACDDRRDTVLVLRALVDLSDDDDGRLNLTTIPSFQDLSPEMQRYLTDLENAANQSPRPSEFVKNALALLDVPECEESP